MILLNSILVATDFGRASEAALNYGRNLTRAFGANLHLLHVIDNRVAGTVAEFYPQEGYDRIEASASKSLNACLTGDDKSRLRARTVLRVSGAPDEAIVEYARDAHVDLIVIGTHGREGVAHLLMGSVAEKVVRSAPCPVLVVRAKEHEFILPEPVAVHARI